MSEEEYELLEWQIALIEGDEDAEYMLNIYSRN
jgi:uncharacterized membrane protein YjdF